jgi:2-dehydro-3-deoxygluconokinase
VIRKNNKIFCFGELLLRYSPQSNGNWFHQNTMPAYIGGAELNVATALANWGMPVKYCTALPNNFLADDVLIYLKEKNIDTSAISISGSRIGAYYLQQGSDLKNAAVVYDRAYSSFAELKTGMIDWDKILDEVSWFHFSAISPSLNENIAAVCKEALQAASKKNIPISVDLNYRKKLWQYGKQPVDIMPRLVEHCDVVMGNIWSANTLLGIPVDANVAHKKELYWEHAFRTSAAIQKQFPKCRATANTFRFDNERISYYAALFTGGQLYHSKEFNCNNAINRIGSGDCFMAGLIYGLQLEHAPQNIIDFASSAAFGKLQESGDATTQTIEEIKQRL